MDTITTSPTHHRPLKRSRFPSRDDDEAKNAKSHRREHRHSHRDSLPQKDLPFNSPNLHKHDLQAYRALFAEYLDRRKGLDIGTLDAEEVRGRWKSFLGKWNRGELGREWYDPETKRRADRSGVEAWLSREVGKTSKSNRDHISKEEEQEGDDEEAYGPTLPTPSLPPAEKKGPTIPTTQDLLLKTEQALEDSAAHRASLRHERKEDRKLQHARLEELAPRADPGSRERQLEKKREVAASNKAFAEGKEAGAEEVGDGELLGDEGGVEGFKARLKAKERAKNEREVRKEEVLRARAVEREEKLKGRRRKEEETMEMLRGLARARFGGDGVEG